MATILEQIRAKIDELETRIADLRVTERELLALEKVTARRAGMASEPKPRRKSGPRATPKSRPTTTRRRKLGAEPKAHEPSAAPQTIGAAISEVLGQHGALSAAAIAEHIKATGQDVSNRSVSFALQALKRRGLAKNTDGEWALKTRSRRARSTGDA
jgi:Ribonuclease R winged-helix domain